MKNKKQDTSLTKTKLLAYLNRRTGQEANRLEKELVGEEFENEALEGYQKISAEQATGDLNRLDQQLKRRISPGSSWWRAAAAISFLVMASFATWWLVGEQSGSEEIAEYDKQEQVDPADTMIEEDLPVIEEAAEEEALDVSTRSDDEIIEVNEPEPVKEPAEKKAAPVPDEIQILEPAPEADAELSNRAFEESITTEAMGKGEVALQMDQVQPMSTARMKSFKEEEVATSVEVLGFSPEGVQGLKPPEFIGGLSAFEAFIKEQKEYPKAARENNIVGSCILSVSVTANGEIGNIDVVESLGYGCDEEAIRLMKAWIGFDPAMIGQDPVSSSLIIKFNFP